MANRYSPSNGSHRELELFRELLLNKRAELLSGFRLKLETMVRPENPEAEDLALLLHERHAASQLSEIDMLQLRLVTNALNQLDGDSDIACEECGAPIAERLLRAMPATRRCIHCHERASRARLNTYGPSESA